MQSSKGTPPQSVLAIKRDVPTFEHFILTRFNVRYIADPHAPSIAVQPEWLESRFGLFEQYCLPSLISQTEQDFTWLLFFDAATPNEFADRAQSLLSQRPRSYAIFCDQLPLERVVSEVRQKIRGAPEWIITTRLDNDDGLHEEFVSTVQNSVTFDLTEVINIPLGIILSGQKTYVQRHPSNAFISLAEPYITAQTVFSIVRHNQANKSYPVRQAGLKPLWLQVIHSNNISNRVKGWRVRSNTVSSGFLSLTSQSPEETDREIFKENITRGPVRVLRDIGVISLKALAAVFHIELRRTVKRVATARKSHNAQT